MNKLEAVTALLSKGSEVADPVLWKTRQITATAISALIVALLNVLQQFGVDLGVDVDTISSLSVLFIAVFNILLTVITTKKIGVNTSAKD